MCQSKCFNGCGSTEITQTYMGDSFCSKDCILTFIQVSTGDNFTEAKETYELNKDVAIKVTLTQALKDLEDANLFNLQCDKCGTPMYDYYVVHGTQTCSEQCRSEFITDEEYDATDCGASDDVYWTESDLYTEVGDILWDENGKVYEVI